MVLVLLSTGLLLHESVYLSSRGFSHFVDDLAPALGLHLKPYLRVGLHVLFVGSITVSLFYPKDHRVTLVVLLLLTVLIAAFPKRVPNHLAVAWFFLAAICLDPSYGSSTATSTTAEVGPFSIGAIQLLTVATYLFAGFHKLNRTFMNPEKSCGSGLLLHYLLQRGFHLTRIPNWVVIAGIYAVLVFEIGCPLLLIANPTTRYGVLLIALLALTFGFLGHSHFSVLMLAGLASFIEIPSDVLRGSLAVTTYLPIGILLAVIGGNTVAYKYRRLALLNYAILSTAVVGLAHQVLVYDATSKATLLALHDYPLLLILLIAAYTLNAAAPYLGLKMNFSLVMFSNLRPDLWDHLIVRRPLRLGLPRYITAISVECAVEHQDKVHRLLAQLCPHYEYDHYSIGYINEVFNYICRSIGENAGIVITGRDIITGRRLALCRHGLEILKWYEKLCVYPYRVPGSGDPLCA